MKGDLHNLQPAIGELNRGSIQLSFFSVCIREIYTLWLEFELLELIQAIYSVTAPW